MDAQVVREALTQRWTPRWAGLWIIFARRGVDISAYPSILAHLQNYKTKLIAKPNDWRPSYDGEKWAGRKEGTYAWYELQDSTDYYPAFDGPKIIYQAIQFHPRYSFDETSLYTSNKTFVITGAERSLLAILNSPLIWWYSLRHFVHMKDEALSNDGFKMEALPIAKAALTSAQIFEKSAVIERKSRTIADATASMRAWLRSEFGVITMKAGLTSIEALDTDSFISAVKANLAKGRKFTAAELVELKREHAATIEPARLARIMHLFEVVTA